MNVFFTVTTIQELPGALAIRENLQNHHPGDRHFIGLADDATHLPAEWVSLVDVITLDNVLPNPGSLSRKYNPVEFAAAVKPLFLRHIWNTYKTAERFIYLSPSIYLYRPLTLLEGALSEASLLVTPHLLHPLTDTCWPDEKYFQNVGLYQSDFLALRRSDEAAHFVNWWADRVPERAFVNFCEAQCLDQIWLMLGAGYYENFRIVKRPDWNIGLWNLHERLEQITNREQITFINFDGLINRSLLFDQQERAGAAEFRALSKLISDYQQIRQRFDRGLSQINPAFGQMPIKYPLPAWRKSLAQGLRQTVQFIETVHVPRNR